MAMLCICGICIPYTVLWPIVLIFLKQVWSFFVPSSKSAKELKKSSGDKKIHPNASNHGIPLDYKTEFVWEDVIGNEKHSVFRFTAKWCKPCKTLDPVFHDLYKEAREKAVFYNVDVDECDEIAALNGAITIPLFVIYREGKQVGKLSSSDHDQVRSFVREHVAQE